MAGFSETQQMPTPHMSLQALSYVYVKRINSSGIWQACSPALNACDFLWGCLKDRLYNNNP
jgi:hypothetical protein